MHKQLAQGHMARRAVWPQIPTHNYYMTKRKYSGAGLDLEVQGEQFGSLRH